MSERTTPSSPLARAARKRLWGAVRASGVTQAGIGRRVGLSTGSVSRKLGGHQAMTLEEWIRIGEAIGLDGRRLAHLFALAASDVGESVPACHFGGLILPADPADPEWGLPIQRPPHTAVETSSTADTPEDEP